MLSRLRTIARSLFHRRHFEEGLAEELRFHLEQYTQDLIAAGHSPENAARRARIEFGNVDNVILDSREARGLRVVDTLQQRPQLGVVEIGLRWTPRRRHGKPCVLDVDQGIPKRLVEAAGSFAQREHVIMCAEFYDAPSGSTGSTCRGSVIDVIHVPNS